MKPLAALGVAAWMLVLGGVSCRPEAPTAPNIVLFISDDHGFPDYGFMGSERVETPHLDRLAEGGLVYTRGYATPSCAPSLSILLTGSPPHRNGITGNDQVGPILTQDRTPLAERTLDNEPLLPRVLADAGYLTFQIGKLWNTTHADVGFTHGTAKERERSGGPLGQWRGDMAPVREFLELAERSGKPFFLWAAPYLPHRPHNPPERLRRRVASHGDSESTLDYFAMVAWLDEVFGELESLIAEYDPHGNTLWIYLADNGFGPDRSHRTGSNPRGKHSGYELGIRTPILLRGPGVDAPRREEDAPVSLVDIVPTILSAAGLPRPGSLPGVDLLDPSAVRTRGPVFLSVFTPAIRDLSDPVASLRTRIAIDGFWKLLVPGPSAPLSPGDPDQPALYDLRADPNERSNLASARPDVVEDLLHDLDTWWDVGPDRAQPARP